MLRSPATGIPRARSLLDPDGKIITESTVICEHLQDELPSEPSQRPADSYGGAQMRMWTKWVDEYFC